MTRNALGTVSLIALTLTATPALADSYTKANFSGGIFGGNANVQPPFSGNGFTQGQTFGGTFVYDNNLIPSNGSGFGNVSPASFPDVANIPAADQFTFNFGPLVFTPTGSDLFDIQYNNGHFNGFVYVDTFAFQGGSYQLNISGGSLSVYQLLNGTPSLNSLVNGFINIGDNAVTAKSAYIPHTVTGSVPEPSTWAMMLLGFGLVGLAMRKRSNVRTTVSYA